MTVMLGELNRMGSADFAASIGDTFEWAPWVAEAAAARRPFATVTALHDAMMGALRLAPRERQLEFLRGHPDLAGKAARSGALTDDSRREQASVGLDSLDGEEFTRFHRLNDAYKAKFGFPFMICVRRHSRESILRQFERRLGNDAATEFTAALQEVFYITRLRVAGEVTGEGMPLVNGRLSTHVLDTHAGRPAAGIAIELHEFAGERAHRIASSPTDRCPSAAMNCALRWATTFAAGVSRAVIHLFSISCLCAFPLPSRRGIITSRCSARPGAIRPIAEVKRRKE